MDLITNIIQFIINLFSTIYNTIMGILLQIMPYTTARNIFILIVLLIVLYPLYSPVTTIIMAKGFGKNLPKWLRDNVRLFPAALSSDIYRRVNHRCEWRTGHGRCRAHAQNADHWIPHAKGGATSQRNMVALCEKHNKQKSDSMPSLLMTLNISFHRLFYMRRPIMPGALFQPLITPLMRKRETRRVSRKKR